MSRFKSYSPEQAYLLPPSVQDELNGDHLCFFLRRVVERLDLSGFEQAYAAEGGALYAPELMLSVWLYAYATGITSARQMERRLVEDLPLRYLAAGARVDNWALSAFRRRHQMALIRADSLRWRGTRDPKGQKPSFRWQRSCGQFGRFRRSPHCHGNRFQRRIIYRR
jgi:hypothetical protein